MASKIFSQGAGILHILAKGTDGELGKMFDLSSVPPRRLEIERKYEVPTDQGVDTTVTSLTADIANLVRKNTNGMKWTPFVGIDQYWILQDPKGVEASFRYRFGSNRPPELTAKVQLSPGDNEKRAEFDLDVRDADMQNIRAFMSTVCLFAEHSRHFCVHQSGNFWRCPDQQGGALEVVAYKVGKLDEEASRVFAEIEAKYYRKPEEAIRAIDSMEESLLLVGRRQTLSFAELFG